MRFDDTVPVERPDLSGAGVRLVADAYGPPGVPVVLLAHGAGQTRHSWARTARAIARVGMRAIAFDARGRGDSERAPDSDYRTDAFVADLAAIVDGLDDPPVLVGRHWAG